jgi:hypothetical protein
MAKTLVMVLNDGETYTNLAGCSIMVFDEEPTDEMVKNPESQGNLVGAFALGKENRIVFHTWKDCKFIIDSVWDR